MQQRQPRLGDVIDDYCPRERRITNHAVVAMVGRDVKQTRCTTCEAEHEYKHARVPARRKKKESVAALQEELLKAPDAPRAPAAPPEAVVLAGPEPTALPVAAPQALAASPGEEGEPPARVERPRQRTRAKAPAATEATPPEPLPPAASPVPPALPPAAPVAQAAPPPGAAAPPAEEPEPLADMQEGSDDEGPVHRRLIRATLPRPEGQVVRPTPQFTLRQPAGRPPGFGGKAGGARPLAGGGGRPHGAGGAGRGGRAGSFPRGGSGSDAFGRARGRDTQHARRGRHPHAGHPPRPGKKHSK